MSVSDKKKKKNDELLFCPVLSPAFFKFYITVGITDMADGAEARRTGTVSEFVSRLDTAAVICMVATAAAIQEGYRISCCVEKNNAYAWNERK